MDKPNPLGVLCILGDSTWDWLFPVVTTEFASTKCHTAISGQVDIIGKLCLCCHLAIVDRLGACFRKVKARQMGLGRIFSSLMKLGLVNYYLKDLSKT